MHVRFAVISDTHFDVQLADDRSWWNKLLHSRQDDMATSLVSTVRGLAPEFVIHCGDVTNQGDESSFRRAKEVLDELGCPCHFVLGNHDTYHRGTRELVPDLFGLAWQAPSRSEHIAGLRFLLLDASYRIAPDGAAFDYSPSSGGPYVMGPRAEDLAWLSTELDADAETPTFLVTHPPLLAKSHYSIGSMPVCEPTGAVPPGRPILTEPVEITPAWYPARQQELLRIIRRARNLVGVLAGHWHIQDLTTDDGTLHCQTGALVEFPFAIRLITIHRRRLSVETVPLDDPSLNVASVVPQWRNLWVEGTPQDKRLAVPLRTEAGTAADPLRAE